jgi:arylsulfatase
LGIAPEQHLSFEAPTSGRHIVGVEFNKESISKNLEAIGQMKLYIDDKVVAEGSFRTQTGHYALCGEGLCIGYDGGDAVSSEYSSGFKFSVGEVIKVVFNVGNDVYVDVERKLAAAMARD